MSNVYLFCLFSLRVCMCAYVFVGGNEFYSSVLVAESLNRGLAIELISKIDL